MTQDKLRYPAYCIYSPKLDNGMLYVDNTDRLMTACKIFGVEFPDYGHAGLGIVPNLDAIVTELQSLGADIHIATDIIKTDDTNTITYIANELHNCKVKGCTHYKEIVE